MIMTAGRKEGSEKKNKKTKSQLRPVARHRPSLPPRRIALASFVCRRKKKELNIKWQEEKGRRTDTLCLYTQGAQRQPQRNFFFGPCAAGTPVVHITGRREGVMSLSPCCFCEWRRSRFYLDAWQTTELLAPPTLRQDGMFGVTPTQ
jgi:hypothetical protein